MHFPGGGEFVIIINWVLSWTCKGGKCRVGYKIFQGDGMVGILGFKNHGACHWFCHSVILIWQFENWKLTLKTVPERLAMPQSRNYDKVPVQSVCIYFFHDNQDWVASQPILSLKTGSQLLEEHSKFGAECWQRGVKLQAGEPACIFLNSDCLPQENCRELILSTVKFKLIRVRQKSKSKTKVKK